MRTRRTRAITLLVALVLVLSIVGWGFLRGTTTAANNNAAIGYATNTVQAVAGGASAFSLAHAGSGRLTKVYLSQAIADVPANVQPIVLRAVSATRATFTVSTPQEKNMCAWVPLSYNGPSNRWPVHFC
jgi:hypothetical protein